MIGPTHVHLSLGHWSGYQIGRVDELEVYSLAAE